MKKKLEKLRDSNIKQYIYIVLPALFLAILAYFFKPYGDRSCDLTEYYGWMDKMLTFNQKDLISYLFRGGEIIVMLYLYIIALIGNYQLLQVFPTFILYFIIFYIIYDYAKRNNISKKYKFIVILTFLSLFKYIFVVSTFRYSLAYSIFTLGVYFDFIAKKKEKRYKILYILPIFIHASTIILLFFRIFFNFKNMKFFRFMLGLIFAVCLFPQIFIKIFYIFDFIPFVDYLFTKAEYYLINENVDIFLQYAFRISQSILFFILGIIVYKCNKKSKEKNYILHYLIISLFTIIIANYSSKVHKGVAKKRFTSQKNLIYWR